MSLYVVGNDVQGVNICRTIRGNTHLFSCVYVIGSTPIGCQYFLTGTFVDELHGAIIGMNYSIMTVFNLVDYTWIVVKDGYGLVVLNRTFNSSREVKPCATTTTDSGVTLLNTTYSKNGRFIPGNKSFLHIKLSIGYVWILFLIFVLIYNSYLYCYGKKFYH